MKIRFITFSIMLFCFLSAKCQQTAFVDKISALIQNGEFEIAEKEVDEVLSEDHNNTDALMLKGNIIINKYIGNGPDVFLGVNNDESIFNTSIGHIGGQAPLLISKEVCDKVEKLWLKAIDIDNTREDIRLGLCHLYSISLDTESLIAYLPTLVKNISLEQPHYSISDYARNLIEREKFEDGMRVYKEVYKLYSDQFGLLSDIAAEYYKNENIDSCKHYLNRAFPLISSDEISLQNCFFLYSVLGEYEQALKCAQRFSELTKDDFYRYYKVLLDNYKGKVLASELEELSKSKNENYRNAANILLDENLSAKQKYEALVKSPENDGIKILMHHAYIQQSKWAYFNYCEVLTYNHRYFEAIEHYKQLMPIVEKDDSEVKPKDIEIYVAWAYHKTKQKSSALIWWEKNLSSKFLYQKSAGAYFLGINEIDNGNIDKALEYFRLVSDQASESKYATYCWNLVNKYAR